MKQKKQISAAMILLAVVTTVCYKGMRAIDNKRKKERSRLRRCTPFSLR